VWEKETPMMGASGPRWHLVTVARIKDPITGESAFLLSENDITAKKKLEKENSDKDTFLGMVSHEIRTPINGIIGFNSLLLETNLTEEQRDFTLSIQRSATLLLAHVNDLLDFAKMAEGKLRTETALVNLEEVVETVRKLTRPLAEEKRLELRCTVDKSIPRVLFGDPLRITQILMNFMSNAVKFTARGYIHVKVKACKDRSPPRTSLGAGDEAYLAGMNSENSLLIQLSVKDTGIGVPRDMRKAIFGKFVQADSSISRRFGGTGLGLAICKRLARMMGGDCSCQSPVLATSESDECGPGSVFWATLRVRTKFEAKHPAKFFLVHPQLTPFLHAAYVSSTPPSPSPSPPPASEAKIEDSLRPAGATSPSPSPPPRGPARAPPPAPHHHHHHIRHHHYQGYAPLIAMRSIDASQRAGGVVAAESSEGSAGQRAGDGDDAPTQQQQQQLTGRTPRIKMLLGRRDASVPPSPLQQPSSPSSSPSSPGSPSAKQPSLAKQTSFSYEHVSQSYHMLKDVLGRCANVEVECVKTAEGLEAMRRELARAQAQAQAQLNREWFEMPSRESPEPDSPQASPRDVSSGLLDDDDDDALMASKKRNVDEEKEKEKETEKEGGKVRDREATKMVAAVVCLVEVHGQPIRDNQRTFRRFLSSYLYSSKDHPRRASPIPAVGGFAPRHKADVWLISGVSETINCFLNSCVFRYADPAQPMPGWPSPPCRPAAHSPHRRSSQPLLGFSSSSSSVSPSEVVSALQTRVRSRSSSTGSPPSLRASEPEDAIGAESERAMGTSTDGTERLHRICAESVSTPVLSLRTPLGTERKEKEEEKRTETWKEARDAVAVKKKEEGGGGEEERKVRKKREVLVVEDNAMNQKLIRSILQREGYAVEVAGDGLEALEVIRRKGLEPFSLVLMDIQMPKMNGYECTEAIRRLPDPLALTIPIIGVSATSGEDMAERCLSTGMNATISKPYSLHTIRSHLSQYASSSRPPP
jgi:signal transduction histidine kinase/CheY-like chemotaxis protein